MSGTPREIINLAPMTSAIVFLERTVFKRHPAGLHSWSSRSVVIKQHVRIIYLISIPQTFHKVTTKLEYENVPVVGPQTPISVSSKGKDED